MRTVVADNIPEIKRLRNKALQYFKINEKSHCIDNKKLLFNLNFNSFLGTENARF